MEAQLLDSTPNLRTQEVSSFSARSREKVSQSFSPGTSKKSDLFKKIIEENINLRQAIQ
jgi:hypothetical protein